MLVLAAAEGLSVTRAVVSATGVTGLGVATVLDRVPDVTVADGAAVAGAGLAPGMASGGASGVASVAGSKMSSTPLRSS